MDKKRVVKDNKSLVDYYIQSILHSHLLLDEDLENTLDQYLCDHINAEEEKLTKFQKFVGVMSASATALVVQKKLPLAVTAATFSPLVVLGLAYWRNIRRRKNYKQNLEKFIEAAKNIAKMNRMIFEYFKFRRYNFSPETANILNPFTQGMKDLIKVMFEEEVDLLFDLRIIIRQFLASVPSLRSEYEYLDNVDFNDFQNSNIEGIDDCVTYIRKLCDVYMLVISNFLACMAITLSGTVYDEDIAAVFSKIVPKVKTACTKCYQIVSSKFDDCKYFYLKKSAKKLPIKKPKPDAASKLVISTYNTMIYTTDILIKSRIIYKELKKVDLRNKPEKDKLGKCLYELRDHVFDFYESLDLLSKLYEISVNCSAQDHNGTDMSRGTTDTDNVSSLPDASLNPVEPTHDEEYELYIGANDASSDEANFCYLDEQESRRFACLLGHELKQKLRAHARFVAARKRRGIADEEQEPEPSHSAEVVNFNESGDDNPPIHFMNERIFVPPPPPPPLLPLDFGAYGGNNDSLYTVNDFLESIQAAIRSRNNAEEVFGDDLDE